MSRRSLERADDVVHLADGVVDEEVVVAELHPAGLDLAEVEHVVDQLEQVLARGVDVLEALVALVLLERDQVVLEDLAEPEDGVERGAQLVAHVGEELALEPRDLVDLGVAALELALLLGDLRQLHRLALVQAGVVDGDGRLVGDDLHQRLLDGGEGPHLAPRHGQRAHQSLRRLQRHDQAAARRMGHRQVLEAAVLGGVGHRHHLAALRGPADDALAELERGHLGDRLGEGEGGDGAQALAVLVEQEDGGGVAGHQVGGGLQHEVDGLFQLQAGGEEIADLTEQVDNDLVVHGRASIPAGAPQQTTFADFGR